MIFFIILFLCSPSFAHIGIESAYFEGNIGSYSTRIIIEPPGVVPGLANIKVISIDKKINKVSIRPVDDVNLKARKLPYEDIKKSEDFEHIYESNLWFMIYGSYGVEVLLDGEYGKSESITIPVNSISFKTIEMSTFMSTVLWALLLLLFFGGVNIISVAYSESTLSINEQILDNKIKKLFLVRMFSGILLVFAIYLGYQWWLAVETQFIKRLYKPYPISIDVKDSKIHVKIPAPSEESEWLEKKGTIREHGKIADEHNKKVHIYIYNKDKDSFMIHTHPIHLLADYEFEACLPSMNKGDYILYADIAHEDGYSHTITDSFSLLKSITNKTYQILPECDPDNSYSDFSNNNFKITWKDKKEAYTSSDNIVFDFKVIDTHTNSLVQLDKYIGMGSHSVILGLDSQFYMHMHPLGTISMSAQESFMHESNEDFVCDFGLIEENGKYKNLDGKGRVTFPAINLKSGKYRLFMQVKIKETQEIISKKFDFTVI